MSRVTVDQFYGIEIDEFPARIAEVALWMMDHITNNEVNLAFGLNYANIPLKGSPHILHGDALEADWAAHLPPEKCTYVFGNPPFVGKKEQSPKQKGQVRTIFGNTPRAGSLDYVAGWFELAARFVEANPRIRFAFVATNSITQGEQVAPLWNRMFERYGLEITFAHRTFEWTSEARGKAHVHVVIVGMAKIGTVTKFYIFNYGSQVGEPTRMDVRHIGPTLDEGRNISVLRSENAISPRPQVQKGSEATDFGHLTISESEVETIKQSAGFNEKWLRLFLGGDEYINSIKRYCLWLVSADPSEVRRCAAVVDRLKKVAEARAASPKARTREWSRFPSLFSENRQPRSRYLLIPKVSSQNRDYIPIGFCDPEVIVSGSAQYVQGASLFDFGLLTSNMHMAWMRAVGGRTKSDYQYSNSLVYNTFPWPEATQAQRAKIEKLAQAVLDARAEHPNASLADLYDPDTMPVDLRKAHAALDKAIDKLYRPTEFDSDRDRVEHLFGRYEALVSPMLRNAAAPRKRAPRSKAALGAQKDR